MIKDFVSTFKLDGLGYTCCIESNGLDHKVINSISYNIMRDIFPYLIKHDFNPSSFIMKASNSASKASFLCKSKEQTLRLAYGIYQGGEDQGADLWAFYDQREYKTYKWLSNQLFSLLNDEDVGLLGYLEGYGLNLHTFRMEAKRNNVEQSLFL